jgi:hypothetical protein
MVLLSRLLLILSLLSASAAAADPALPILLVSDGGYSWLIVGEDGMPQIYRFSQVIIVGTPKTPPVVVTPPATGFGLETQARQWMLTVTDPAKAQAADIRKLLEIVGNSAASYQTIGEMEAAIGALLTATIRDRAAWSGFGASLQSALSTLKSPTVGKIKTPADLGKALLEVAKGMPQ